jgi:hypothetical protein
MKSLKKGGQAKSRSCLFKLVRLLVVKVFKGVSIKFMEKRQRFHLEKLALIEI